VSAEKKVETWMPWYIDKYLGDTTNLTTEQHGAYCLLLMSSWKKDGRLPNHEGQLAAIARLTAAKWRAYSPVLMEFFSVSEDGKSLMQKRLTQELIRAKAISQERAKAGAEGAAKRWLKHGKDMANAMAKDEQSGWQFDAPIQDTSPEAKASVEAAKPPRASRKCPKSWEPSDPQAWIDQHCPGVDWMRETEKFRDYTFKNPISEWLGAWRNWMRKAFDDMAMRRGMTYKERDAANAAARVHEMTGGLVSAKPAVVITRRNDALQEVFDATPRLVG